MISITSANISSYCKIYTIDNYELLNKFFISSLGYLYSISGWSSFPCLITSYSHIHKKLNLL